MVAGVALGILVTLFAVLLWLYGRRHGIAAPRVGSYQLREVDELDEPSSTFWGAARERARTWVRAMRPSAGVVATSNPEQWVDASVGMVRAALADFERGEFKAAGALADLMRRDDRIFSTLDTRVLGALGLPKRILRGLGRKADLVARGVEPWFWRVFSKDLLADVLRWVILVGFCVGQVTWKLDAGEYRPTLTIFHPQFVRVDYQGVWWLQTLEGPKRITPGEGGWFLATAGRDRPWMNGAIRALAVPWLVRQFGFRDWARRSEIDGVGVRIARVPKGIDEKLVDRFLRAVQRLGAESTLRLPEGFDFEIKSTTQNVAEGFNALIGRCDIAITLVMLGQNLTTEVTGGSRAAATVHERVQLDRLEADVAILSEACATQILLWWGRYNVEGFDDAACPVPEWDATPPEDLAKRAQWLLSLSQALPALIEAGVDLKPVLERFDLHVQS